MLLNGKTRILVPNPEVHQIDDFLKKFGKDIIGHTNTSYTLMFNGTDLEDDPLYIDYIYNLCKEARQNLIIFLDLNDLNIIEKTTLMQN